MSAAERQSVYVVLWCADDSDGIQVASCHASEAGAVARVDGEIAADCARWDCKRSDRWWMDEDGRETNGAKDFWIESRFLDP